MAIIGKLLAGFAAFGRPMRKLVIGVDEHEVYDVAQFFIPIFFVSVGAAVDLRRQASM